MGQGYFYKLFRGMSYLPSWLTWATVGGLGKERTQPVGHYPNDLASILCQPRILDSQTRNTEWALCHSVVAGVLPRACGNDCHLGSVDLVSSLILVSFIRQRALLWASKRVTHTVQLSIIICFHSLWPQRGMAVFELSVCNVRVADRWLAH